MPRKGEDRWTWRISLLGGSGLELIERRSGQYLYVVNYSSHSPLWPIHHMISYPIVHKWSTCQSVWIDHIVAFTRRDKDISRLKLSPSNSLDSIFNDRLNDCLNG
jgi:hypothetical protein